MHVKQTRNGGRVVAGHTPLLKFRIELDPAAAAHAGDLLYITDGRGNTLGEVEVTFGTPRHPPPPDASAGDCSGCGDRGK